MGGGVNDTNCEHRKASSNKRKPKNKPKKKHLRADLMRDRPQHLHLGGPAAGAVVESHLEAPAAGGEAGNRRAALAGVEAGASRRAGWVVVAAAGTRRAQAEAGASPTLGEQWRAAWVVAGEEHPLLLHCRQPIAKSSCGDYTPTSEVDWRAGAGAQHPCPHRLLR